MKNFSFLSKILITALCLEIIRIVFIEIFPKKSIFFENFLPLSRFIWWFISGCAFYSISKGKHITHLLPIILLTFACNLIHLNFEGIALHLNLILTTYLVIFYLLFFIIFSSKISLKYLETKSVIWIGGISYEIYLLHEAIGVSILSLMKSVGIDSTTRNIAYFLITCGTVIFLSFTLRKCSTHLLNSFPTHRGKSD